MGGCSVIGCCMSSKNQTKVTLHRLPTSKERKKQWLNILGVENLNTATKRMNICSLHFEEKSFDRTLDATRLRDDALPSRELLNQMHTDDTNKIMVCRICLVADTRLFPITKFNLKEAYEHLTGLTVPVRDSLPQRLCAECAHRLGACVDLRRKSLTAHSVLVDLLDRCETLSIEAVKSIDRQSHKLTSTLSARYFATNHCDLQIEHDDTQKLNFDEITLPIAETIKNECDENEFYDEHDTRDEHNDVDYSSDDSISLERFRKLNDKATVHNNIDDKNDKSEPKVELTESDIETDGSFVEHPKLSRNKHKKHTRLKKKLKVSVEPKIDRRRRPLLNGDLNETLFTITELTVDEQKAQIEKRQESANYRNAVFKCTECFKGFLDEAAYNGHMARHTKKCGEFRCDICKTHFKSANAVRKHHTAHHTQRFSCNQCPNYVTTHRQTARLHERWHKGTKYQCPHCQDEFVKFTTYMGHVRIKHPSDFVCQLCGYSFVSEKGIELHKKLKHRLDDAEIPSDGPQCEPCSVRFVSAEALRQHLRVSARHTQECREANKPKKPRKDCKDRDRTKNCREEDKHRAYPSQLRKAEGPIPCEQCGLQLEDSRAYHSHFRRMHPDKNRTKYPSMKSPCMCEVCGRIFQSYALLKDHRWVHTGERPFKCDTCGKSFRMKQRLVAHRRVHSAMKASYLCNLCGKHFSTHSNRQRHMFIHTGLKPFKCEMCGKGFKHASEKRAHVTYVHLKKPWPKRTRSKRRDLRQGSLPPQSSLADGGSEMDIVQPVWPACDPKIDHINTMMDDKPMYYNLKI